MPRLLLLTLVALLVLAGSGRTAAVDVSRLPPAATRQVDFDQDIRPILEASCLRCHGPERPKSRFRLDNREAALKGGDIGGAIVPGDSAASRLVHYVAGLEPDMLMPPQGKGDPLGAEQIGLLRAWIDQGAPWSAAAEAASVSEMEVVPTVGWATVDGNEARFREHWWAPEGWTGGARSFEWRERVGSSGRFTAEGRGIIDAGDYGVRLKLEQPELGFVRVGYDQFRRYYNDAGGYYQPFGLEPFDLDRDLHLDIRRAWAEFGLTLPHLPRVVLGYEFLERTGDKSTLQWGPVDAGAEDVKAIYPAAKNIDEQTHRLKLDLSYDWRGLWIEDNFRGEFHEADTRRQNVDAYAVGPPASVATSQYREGYDHFQAANVLRLEKAIREWLFVSGGYLYNHLDGDADFSVESYFGTAPDTPPFLGDRSNQIVLNQDSHILNANARLGPWQGLTFNTGVQSDWTRQEGFGEALLTSEVTGEFAPALYSSDLDRRTVEENLGLRYTRIPYTVLYADTRFQQEALGQYEASSLADGADSQQDFLRDTDAENDLREYRVGFTVSPWPRVSLQTNFRHRDRDNDYDHRKDTDLNPQLDLRGNGYPALIRARETATDEVEAKLILRVRTWLKTSLRYQLVATDYRTTTAPSLDPFEGTLYPGGDLLAGNYDAHIYTLGATATPWRRLYLSSSFSYATTRLVSGINQNPAIAPYAGDLYNLLASVTYLLTDDLDWRSSYSYSRADYRQSNTTAGLPLGIEYDRFAFTTGFNRRLTRHVSAGLKYGFFYYHEPTAGNANDYIAHAVFASCTLRRK